MIIKPEKFTPVAVEGLSILDLTGGIDSELSIARISLSPRAQRRRSLARESDRYYYVLFGRLEFVLNDNAFQVRAGELCLVRKGQAYAYGNPSDEPADLLLIDPSKHEAEAEIAE